MIAGAGPLLSPIGIHDVNTPTPFTRILIANRGEIALRVIRSAQALGYRTVAVYSAADANAPHVAQAEQAVCIGEPLPAQSYLRIPALIEAARKTGADAVHPGYGFLAENADFAAACREAGLVFIGPSPEAIRAMGDKAGAKRLISQAGIACIPGYQGEDQSEDRLAAEALRIGFPLMIKATAGGGGRGLRKVESAEAFVANLRSAQSEARNALGDATVILERALEQPRHVEIQIFADRHGNVVHLGERDCSVQRRHQKVIEEAPSPAVSPALRERMGATAVAAVRAIGYEGAGTLEFLLTADGSYYFMEMNTRLQVEHPVTEAITGLDLVEWQLRVAAGEPLPLTQDRIRFSGHAIEARLCAEDPDAGFTPQSGSIEYWHPSASIRVEHALASGSEVPAFYDSMIAKLVARGRSREEARRKLLTGLQDTALFGIRSNQHFLSRCLAHPSFVDGQATTAFVDQFRDALLQPDSGADDKAALLGAWLLAETQGELGRAYDLAHRLPIELRFTIDGRARSQTVRYLDARRRLVGPPEAAHSLEVIQVDRHQARYQLDGVIECVTFCRSGERLWLLHQGRAYEFEDRTRVGESVAAGGGGDGRVSASSSGRVVALSVAVGDQVSVGQPLIVLEAMKMEHIHGAPIAGLIKAIHAHVGQQVPLRRVLIEIEPVPGDAGPRDSGY